MVQAGEAAVMRTRKAEATGDGCQTAQVVEDQEQAIMRALRILRARFKERDVLGSPDAVKDFLRLQAQGLTHEVFAVMYLDCAEPADRVRADVPGDVDSDLGLSA
jgi:DNA repair protein RadC